MSETNIIIKLQKITGNIFFKRIVLGLFVIIFFVLIYGLNILYPIYLDDWDYSYIYWHPERVTGLMDAIYSQTIHYVKWGGRTVVHTILQTLIAWGAFWSDLLNSIVFIFFIGILYLISNLNNKTRPSLFFLLVMLTWFFQADIGETIIWLTGSVNYLWGATIIFCFVYFYYRYFFNIQINKPKKEIYKMKTRSVIFFFFGVIAGWTNENMVVAMMCMLTVFLFCIWRKERKLAAWSISGFIGACIGAAFMILAPGNYVRYQIELKAQGLTKAELGFDYYWSRFQVLLDGYIEYLLFLFLIYLLLIALFRFTSKRAYKKQILLSSLLFFGGSIIASMAMIASPSFEPRAWFGIITLVIIAVSIIYANLDFSKWYINVCKWAFVIILSILFAKTYTEGTTELTHLRRIIDNREVELNRQKAEGKSRIVFNGERFEDREHRRLDLIFPKMYDFPQDTTHWMYKAYERYHGVDAIRFENEQDITRIIQEK